MVAAVAVIVEAVAVTVVAGRMVLWCLPMALTDSDADGGSQPASAVVKTQ